MPVVLFRGSHHLDRRAAELIEAANEGTDDELRDTVKTALWLGVSAEWLEIGRSRGWGPQFIKLSPRRVRYRVGDVKKWLAERSFRHTGEYSRSAMRSELIGENGGTPRSSARRARVRLDDDEPDEHAPVSDPGDPDDAA